MNISWFSTELQRLDGKYRCKPLMEKTMSVLDRSVEFQNSGYMHIYHQFTLKKKKLSMEYLR